MERQVIEIMLAQPQNSEGVHVAAIARAIGGDPHQIR
jgi:replication factor A2